MNYLLSKEEYRSDLILDCLFYSLIYRFFYFSTIFDYSFFVSRCIYWGLVLGINIIGYLLTCKNYRKTFSQIIISLLPISIYYLFQQYQYTYLFINMSTLITVLLVILVVYTYMSLHKRNNWNKGVLIYGLIMSLSIGMILNTGLGISAKILSHSFVKRTELFYFSDDYERYTEDINNILSDNWNTYSDEEKCALFQRIVNYKANDLQLNNEVIVILQSLDKNLLGHYDSSNHTIVMNMMYLDDSEMCLSTLFHEIYHANQHELVAAYNQLDNESKQLSYFYRISKYKEEFDHYESKDYFEYSSQFCEIDAEAYSENEMYNVYQFIKE